MLDTPASRPPSRTTTPPVRSASGGTRTDPGSSACPAVAGPRTSRDDIRVCEEERLAAVAEDIQREEVRKHVANVPDLDQHGNTSAGMARPPEGALNGLRLDGWGWSVYGAAAKARAGLQKNSAKY